MQRLVQLALFVSFTTLVGVGCGGEGFTQGSGGAGSGGSEAGSSAGGAGGNGGAGSGGLGIGAVSTGGIVSGGGGSGGSADGGRGGAPAMQCTTDADCMNCAYPTAPASKQQCYCANCANTPMTKAACEANGTAYMTTCADVHLPCPAIACVMPAPAVCKDQMCVAAK